MPCVVTAGVPMRNRGSRTATGDRREWCCVDGDAGPVEHHLGVLAREILVEGTQIDQHEVVVGAARHQTESLTPGAPASAWALATIGGVGRERGVSRLPERHRLAGDHVLERSALETREDRLVDGRPMLRGGEDAPPLTAPAESCAL